MATDRKVYAFEAARILGRHRIEDEDKPKRGAPQKHRRAMLNFYKDRASNNGRVPPPDGFDGKQPWWRESTLQAHIGGEGPPPRRKKKSDERANAHQTKSSSSPQRESDEVSRVTRLKRAVNAKDEARHG